MVAYAPTEEAPEGQKAKCLAALNNNVASVPARDYVFVLVGGGKGSKVLCAYGRDVLNVNGNYC